jgi:hypothetical protein
MTMNQGQPMDNSCNKEYQEFLTNIEAAKLDKENKIKQESNMDSASFFPTSETVKAVNYSRLMQKGLELPIHKVAGDIISTNQRAFQGHRANLVTISQFKEPGLAQAFIGAGAELMKKDKNDK